MQGRMSVIEKRDNFMKKPSIKEKKKKQIESSQDTQVRMLESNDDTVYTQV